MFPKDSLKLRNFTYESEIYVLGSLFIVPLIFTKILQGSNDFPYFTDKEIRPHR